MTVEQFLVNILKKQGVKSITFITPYVGYIELRSKQGCVGELEFSLITQDLLLLDKNIENFVSK